MACRYKDLKEMPNAVRESTKNMGLTINQNNAKFMVVAPHLSKYNFPEGNT